MSTNTSQPSTLTLAFAALPAGALAVKIGYRRAMLYGIGATIIAMGIMVYMGAQIPIILLMIAGFSLIVNGAVPFALSLVPPRWAGLGLRWYIAWFRMRFRWLRHAEGDD